MTSHDSKHLLSIFLLLSLLIHNSLSSTLYYARKRFSTPCTGEPWGYEFFPAADHYCNETRCHDAYGSELEFYCMTDIFIFIFTNFFFYKLICHYFYVFNSFFFFFSCKLFFFSPCGNECYFNFYLKHVHMLREITGHY